MSIASRPNDKKPLGPDGRLTLEWDAFFQSVADFPKAYTVEGLPVSAVAGSIAYASDGRKPGESAGDGTGVLVYFDNAQAWISVHSGVAVTA